MKWFPRQEYLRLLRLGWPVLITELGVIAVGFADTMMVGAYGTDELAAASFVNNLFLVPTVMLIGFASGITPLVGALFGKQNNAGIGSMTRVATRLNLLAGLIFTLVMGTLYLFLDNMGQPQHLMPLIKQYYIIILCTLLPMSMFNCLQQVANGTTDTASPMWVMLLCNVLNIGGNYLLIFGKAGLPELGLQGAGIATAFARWCGPIVLAAIMLSRNRYKPYLAALKRYKAPLSEYGLLFRTSYPIMIQSGIETMLWAFGAVVCGWFGALQLAGYQVIVTISQLGFMTYISFGIACSIRVANCMGERDYTQLRQCVTAALHINLLLCLLASAAFVIAGEHMLRLFTDDSGVIQVGLLLLPPLVLYQVADATQITYGNALRGTSHVSPLLWVSLVAYIVVGIPLMLLLAVGFEWRSVGVFYSFSGALAVAALLLWQAYRRAVRRAERPVLGDCFAERTGKPHS